MLHPTELPWTLIELCCNLKTIIFPPLPPPPSQLHCSFRWIYYIEKTPWKFQFWKNPLKCSTAHHITECLPTLAPPIAASLILPVIIQRKTPRNILVWRKIRQSIPLPILFNRTTADGTVNLQFSSVRIKQWKVYSDPPSSISPFPISPSLIPPPTNPPSRLLGQFDC
jgi:hypothetical protein